MRCRYCDAEVYPENRDCPSCGRRVTFMPSEVPAGGWAKVAPPAAASEAEGTVSGTTAVLDEPAIEGPRIAENDLFVDQTRIVSLFLISGGLYLLYWLFLTWKQLARATEDNHHPVWHALSLQVPLYGLFRLHRHVSVINEVSRRAGLVPSFVPWVFVMLYVVAAILEGQVILATFENRVSTSTLVFHLASVAVVGGIILWAQSTLNTFWLYTLRERLSETRIGVGELIVTGIGALSWLSYL